MEDWALVVGITAYPGLSELNGPEIDAKEFYEWVTSPAGGNIPPDSGRAKLIVSSGVVPPPPFGSANIAKPTDAMIKEVFDEWDEIAAKNLKDGAGRRVGRRLYLYFAGHGFEPDNHVALFMANANDDRFHHLTASAYANFFYRSAYFEETLLFMDCCRDYHPGIAASPVHFPDRSSGKPEERKRFYGFATSWGKKSWERQMDDGQVHGVFTATLMRALKGAACDRNTGEITTATLRSYLKENMRYFLDEKDRENPNIIKEPRVPDEGDPVFVIAKVADIPKYKVTIHIPSEHRGKKMELIAGRKIIPLPAPEEPLELARGLYYLRIDGLDEMIDFQVKGIGAEDVNIR